MVQCEERMYMVYLNGENAADFPEQSATANINQVAGDTGLADMDSGPKNVENCPTNIDDEAEFLEKNGKYTSNENCS